MPSIENDVKLDFIDVQFAPQHQTNIRSRSEVELKRTIKFKWSGRQFSGVPIMAANMDTVGTFNMAVALHEQDLFTVLHKHYTCDQIVEFFKDKQQLKGHIAISTGSGEEDLKKLDEVLNKVSDIEFICVDVANGYSVGLIECIRTIRQKYPDKTIMAGNIVTAAVVKDLVNAGADIVKIGIGPGSVCITRSKTGVGYPQFSAVLECARAAHELGAHIISDGGCTVPGDIAKAFGAGADFVMLGGMLAGHDQSAGQLITDDNGRMFKLFYGMASKLAQEKYNAGLASYRSSEGKVVKIPYRGDVAETIKDILGGLRSTCAYIDAPEISQMEIKAHFIMVRHQLNEVFKPFESK